MNRLAVFDVEGVLIPVRWALIIEVAKRRSPLKLLVMLIFAVFYQVKILKLRSFVTLSYKLLRGSNIRDFFNVYSSYPVNRSSEKVFSLLRCLGYTTVLMSSGLPQEIVDDLKQRLGADHAYGVNVKKDPKGLLTGEIEGTVIENEGKLQLLEEVVSDLIPSQVVVVADDWNNLQMFGACDLFIGFNPDTLVAAKTMTVVQGDDLMPVISIIQGQPQENEMVSLDYLMRKLIHVLGFFTLVAISWLGLGVTKFLIGNVLVLYLLSESLRLSGRELPLFTSITRLASSVVERRNIVTTPVWYALGILLTISLFPFRYAVIGVTTLTVGDPVASAAGHLFDGSTRYHFNKAKSLNGSLAGLTAALIVCLILFGPSPLLLGCLAGMLVESLPLPLNDNITIPISASLTSLILEYILFIG